MTTTTPPYTETYRKLQARLFDEHGLAAHSRFVHLKGISTRIHLFEAGAGEPVVFLHGGAGIGAEHIPVIARLAKRYHVIVPDRPGHGLSDDFDYLGQDLRKASVDFVGALLDELGIERATIVGNSFGGFMALGFALARPERVTRVVTLGFSPGFSRKLPWMMRLMVTPVLGRLLGATVGRPTIKNTRMFFSKLIVAHIERMPDDIIQLETLHGRRHQRSTTSLFREGLTFRGFRQRYVIRDELRHLRVPTSFLWGEHDPFMSVEEGRAVAKLVPGSRFDVIPDAGHLPSWDQPEATTALLEREFAAPDELPPIKLMGTGQGRR